MVGRPLDETELVARAKRGDADAYEELVRTHQGIALRTAYLVAGDETDAQEAAQDAFVKAYRALGRFRAGAPFRPWLLSNRRQRGAEPTPFGGAVGKRSRFARRRTRPRGTRPRPPRRRSSRRSDADELLAAINRLRDEHRLVIACRYLLDLSEEETVAALGVRRGTRQVDGSRGRSCVCATSSGRRTMAELERELRALASWSTFRPSGTSCRPCVPGSRLRASPPRRA